MRVAGSSLLNTTFLEGCPNESPDGRSLFFASNRTGNIDIYVSHRDHHGEWGDPEALPDHVNSAANDFCPTSLPGGGLLFVSERADGLNCGPGKADIYETELYPTAGWLNPEHLGCVVNSIGNEFAPSFVPAGSGMDFFSSDRLEGKQEIYVNLRGPDGAWQKPELVGQLNAPGFNSARPNVSHDGREIVFDSDRPGSTGLDVWYSLRLRPCPSGRRRSDSTTSTRTRTRQELPYRATAGASTSARIATGAVSICSWPGGADPHR